MASTSTHALFASFTHDVLYATRTGPLCARCLEGYSERMGVCEVCGDKANSWVFTVGVVLIAAVLLIVGFWIIIRANRQIMDMAVREGSILSFGGTSCEGEVTGKCESEEFWDLRVSGNDVTTGNRV